MSNINKQALREAAKKATALNLDTAQVKRGNDGYLECPCCEGAGYVEEENDFCNIDGVALGVQFYGIGENHGLAESYLRAANPTTVLALLDELEAKDSMIAAQQHEIRTLLNALEGRPCPKCNDTGMADSGGTQPWGEPIEIECDCRQQDANTAELEAAGIITKVGE